MIDRKNRGVNNRVLGKHNYVTDTFSESLEKELD